MSAQFSDWIWTPEWSVEDDQVARIVCFRKSFVLDSIPESLPIDITADSRYKLYVNGVFVQKGPQKAMDLREWFVDDAEIARYVSNGENVIAVEVLRYGTSAANDSLLRTKVPCLYVSGPGLSGREGWKCRVRREVGVVTEDTVPSPIIAQESVQASAVFAGWKKAAFDDSLWDDAVPAGPEDVPIADAPFNIVPRTIPQMKYEEKRFSSVSAIRSGSVSSVLWEALIREDRPVTVPAHSVQTVEFCSGAEKCGYLLYSFIDGKDAMVTTLCAECYSYPEVLTKDDGIMIPGLPKKGDRTDSEHGKLVGHTSVYTVAGYGTEKSPEEYEPFAFRTFRYVQLRIETEDRPLTICCFRYRATGYPLEVATHVDVSDPSFAPIWNISIRTLKRCMHETYMDCPFYEQLQYSMDARSEMLYTYAVSADDRLARQAMDALRRSQRPDGLLNADAPTVRSNVIPGFSIYYILMVHDHMMYFGDRKLVRTHLPAVDRILSFFDGNINEEGLVGKVGGPIGRQKYWSYIDWSHKWISGVPGATVKGSCAITMESLLYLYGLQKASDLAVFCGLEDLAEQYRQRAEALKKAILSCCVGIHDGHPLIQDGPGQDEFSVHCQVFAVLTRIVTPESGRDMLEKTVGNPDMAQASVAFMFYLFRALELCGWYEKTDELWNLWRQMLKDHLSTCVENDTDMRSDCHAWASLMCYELPAVVLGVKPAAPGFEKVFIRPRMGKLMHACGDVVTPRGKVHVEWKRMQDGTCGLSYTLPEGMTAAE